MNHEEEDDNNEMRLQKIPLAKFLAILMELFDNGVEYIDIVGVTDSQEDYVGVSIIREYLSEDVRDKFNDISSGDNFLSKLNKKPNTSSEEDELNNLI